MAGPQKFNPEKKQQIVISVLRGEMSVAEAARRHGSPLCQRHVRHP